MKFLQSATGLALFLVSVVPMHSLENFEPRATEIRSEPLNLPQEVHLVSFTKSGDQLFREEFTQKRVFREDGSFTLDVLSEGLILHQEFLKNGTLRLSREERPREGIRVQVEVNPARDQATFVRQDQGKAPTSVALSSGIVLQQEFFHVAVQGWRAGIRDGLSFKSYSPDGQHVGDFQIRYVETSRPLSLSDKYVYPAEFQKALPASKTYVVADMFLTGIAALFVPQHFYLIYEKEGPGLTFTAYFGEDPAKAVFQYRKLP